ncbi:hypothetical protein CEXT_381771 [Caerostris extrusa]|uniref:Uncharacterized protein n=1 Tax=Caerostris extrusa TaxID=172846 RepID=A0AAV4WH12_CAEEX|nr:hypothetical protein CEXT_381771 [Caerostris extrusa]
MNKHWPKQVSACLVWSSFPMECYPEIHQLCGQHFTYRRFFIELQEDICQILDICQIHWHPRSVDLGCQYPAETLMSVPDTWDPQVYKRGRRRNPESDILYSPFARNPWFHDKQVGSVEIDAFLQLVGQL